MKDLYEVDSDFQDDFEACTKSLSRDRSPWSDYLLQYGMLLKKNKLHIPSCSMRENLIQEKHNGRMAGKFGIDKTLGFGHFYFWPRMRSDLQRYVSK